MVAAGDVAASDWTAGKAGRVAAFHTANYRKRTPTGTPCYASCISEQSAHTAHTHGYTAGHAGSHTSALTGNTATRRLGSATVAG
jgi:hypothetical protein